MQQNYSFVKYLLVFFMISWISEAFAQNSSLLLWTKKNNSESATSKRDWYPSSYSSFSLQTTGMRNFLAGAPKEINTSVRNSSYIIELPMPDGNFNRYKIADSPVMEEGLANAFPLIKTYSGQGIDDPTATIRFDLTQFGFHGYVLSENGTVYIDPLVFGNTDDYIVYYKSDIPPELYNFHCNVESEKDQPDLNNEHDRLLQIASAQSIGSQLRTYRLALAADGEYSAFYGSTVAGALAGMTTSLNRVNGVYEKEVGIHLNMVANDTLIIFLNSGTDPYTDANGGTMLGQNQHTCDSAIGTANYDMGHVFSTGGGGIASLGCVCRSSTKAEGVTGSTSPVGDAFDIDYVVHEMGHEFGGNHTFNCTTGSCSGNVATNAAYEPGSATTIMGYAGICTINNIQQHSDAYFHTKNFDEIVTYSQTGSGNGCAVITATGNNPPVISFVSTNHTIPYRTPFKLTASASDPDGDSVTYCWEEYDLGPQGTWNAPVGNAPLFRSFTGVTSPTRLFPKLSDILNTVTIKGELLPGYNRSLQFRCTARDNRSGGGGVTHTTSVLTLTVDSTGVPFTITYPNVTGITWVAGDIQTVTWNVGSSDVPPINTPNVNVYLSTNNGQTFPTVLGLSVPNTGSYTFTVPDSETTSARIMVEGDQNVFFDINDKSFAITAPLGIHEQSVSNNINLYPNPATDEIHFVISTPSKGICKITVNDLAGRLVHETILEKKTNLLDQPLDISSIAKGMYIVRFELPEGIAEKKLVKE